MSSVTDLPQRILLRATDLPRSRYFAPALRFLKSFEVMLFKLLEALGIYRGKKSILGVPSLATRQFTFLQAIVYNGTQEEVLGYRPRRLLHRILRGVPDTELFEWVRFQLGVSESDTRMAEGSTETRGFIQLQLPWQLPWRVPRSAWLRMEPSGVETSFGRIRLGDYEIVSAPVFFLTEHVKYVIVSDIDDTIKDSQIAKTTTFSAILGGLFRGHYYTYDPIAGMPELYRQLVEKGALIVYLTSTPYQLGPWLLKFLKQNGFPEGPVFLRWLGYGRVRHKWRTLQKLFGSLTDEQRCILVGDSGEKDLQIYRRICENPTFDRRVSHILIRHVPGTPVQKPLSEKEWFYNDLPELRAQLRDIIGGPAETPKPT